MKSILEAHSLDDEDTYVVLSKGRNDEFATVHIHGDIREVLELLEIGAISAAGSDEQEVVRH